MDEKSLQKAASKAQRKLERKNEKKRMREESNLAADVTGSLMNEEEEEANPPPPPPSIVLAPSLPLVPSSKKSKKNTFIPISVDRSAINLTKDEVDDDDDLELVLIQVPSSMDPKAALIEHGLGEKVRELLMSMSSSSSTEIKTINFDLLEASLRIEATNALDGTLASQIRVIVQHESEQANAGTGEEWEATLVSNAEIVKKKATRMISVLHNIPKLSNPLTGSTTATDILGTVPLRKRGLVPQFSHLSGRAKRTKSIA